jgi:hypothetical protein
VRLFRVTEPDGPTGGSHHPSWPAPGSDPRPVPVLPSPSGTPQAHPAPGAHDPRNPAEPTAPTTAEPPAPVRGGGSPLTVVCCRCDRIKGAPRWQRLKGSTQASHGVCPDCWGPYRVELGLPAKPYTGGAW